MATTSRLLQQPTPCLAFPLECRLQQPGTRFPRQPFLRDSGRTRPRAAALNKPFLSRLPEPSGDWTANIPVLGETLLFSSDPASWARDRSAPNTLFEAVQKIRVVLRSESGLVDLWCQYGSTLCVRRSAITSRIDTAEAGCLACSIGDKYFNVCLASS